MGTLQGFLLFPTNSTFPDGTPFNYTVAHSPWGVDIAGQFVASCRKYGIKPGFYFSLARLAAAGWERLVGITSPISKSHGPTSCFRATPIPCRLFIVCCSAGLPSSFPAATSTFPFPSSTHCTSIPPAGGLLPLATQSSSSKSPLNSVNHLCKCPFPLLFVNDK